MFKRDQKIDKAFQYCLAIAENHYENFPVASRFLNKRLRYPVSAVYAFARSADDFADEGDRTINERLALLDEYHNELSLIEKQLTHWSNNKHQQQTFIHTSENQLFIALADVIRQFEIPLSLFYDLLKAFKQDVTKTRYHHFDEILAYCRLSANPVGRILLYLNHSTSEENFKYSDAICTGLQLINFYQDIAQDMDENDRLYLPLEEMSRFFVSKSDIKTRQNNHQTQALIKHQLLRAGKLYHSGKPLCFKLKGRFAIEIRMIYVGGKLILDKLVHRRSIYERPRLTRFDKFKLVWQGLMFKH